MRDKTVLRPPMTSVWPALCPPWKRATAAARSVRRSTTLPLPSSPHWVPMMTTNLPMHIPISAESGLRPFQQPAQRLFRPAGKRRGFCPRAGQLGGRGFCPLAHEEQDAYTGQHAQQAGNAQLAVLVVEDLRE